MSHILDNPIYHALESNHHHLSFGTDDIKLYHQDFTAFAGFKTYTSENFNALQEISDGKNVHVLFTTQPITPLDEWEIVHTIDMHQMIYDQEVAPDKLGTNIIELDSEHVQQMTDLVDLTKPGPFLSRTIELGNYIGIFDNGKLVSMMGQRLNPYSYVEISAVCTHPEHLGKGYAKMLLIEQIRRITGGNYVPFLHVEKTNHSAVKLYEKVGFRLRLEMYATVLKKR